MGNFSDITTEELRNDYVDAVIDRYFCEWAISQGTGHKYSDGLDGLKERSARNAMMAQIIMQELVDRKISEQKNGYPRRS